MPLADIPEWVGVVVAALAVTGLAGAAVFAVLWWRVRKRVNERAHARIKSENLRIDAELRLAEMIDRMRQISDVHDSAAVAISRVIAQAEGAKFAAESRPDVAARAVGAIADSAREVLNDLRRVVNVGRQGVTDHDESPSMSSLEDLFATMDESGLVVAFEETGTPFGISSSAEIALFRIVQEALNNCRQHAGPGTSVKVSMAWSHNGVQLRIEDDGQRVKNAMREQMGEDTGYSIADDQKALTELLTGRGMSDMKSRTETFGGVFSAHRVPGVGFTVSASFPTLRFHNGIHGVELGSSRGSSPSVGDDD